MSRLRTWWRPSTVALAIIVAAPLALLGRVLFTGRALYWGTVTLQFLPWHELGKRMLLSGHVPLWNHSLGFGAPLLANLQSAFLYPPNLIYLLLPVDVAVGVSMALHLMLAGGFAYLYARSLRVSPHGAALAALAYGLGGYVVGRSQFISMVDAYAWVPLVFLLADRALQRPRWARIAALGAALALQITAGHAQTSYYTVLALTAYLIWRSAASMRSEGWRRSTLRVLAALAGAAAVALLLSAAQVLPTAELTARSQRSDGVETEFGLTYSMWPWRLLTLISPNLFGNPATGDYWGYATYWEDHAYLGVLPLGLALFAVWRFIRKRLRWGATRYPPHAVGFLAVLAVVALLLALGRHSPLYMAAYRWFPGMSAFQAPSRWLLMFAFPASILAGMGLDAVRPSVAWRRRGRLTAAGALSMLAVCLLARGVLSDTSRTFAVALAETALVLLAVGIWLAAVPVVRERRTTAWRWAAVGIVAVDLVAFGAPLVPAAPRVAASAPAPTSAEMRSVLGSSRLMAADSYEYEEEFGRFTQFSTWGPSDAATVEAMRDSLLSNVVALQGLDTASNFEPLLDRRFLAYRDLAQSAPWDVQQGLLARAGVGALVTNRPVDGATPIEGLSQPVGGARLVYRVDAQPRARLVYRTRNAADESSAAACLSAVATDPDVVCVESAAQELQSGRASTPVDAQFADNRVEADVVAEMPALLVLAQMHYPGWQAWVDGHPEPILRADTVFQAIALTPGTHHVVLRFQPGSWLVGAWVSGASVVALIVGWIIERRTNRRKRTHPSAGAADCN